MKIIVTGGCGFVGSYLVDELCKFHEVIVIDDESREDIIYKNKNAFYVKESIISSNIEKYFENCDVLFHLAAKINIVESKINPSKYIETNLLGTQNILNNCVKYKINKIIFSSTSAVYKNKLNITEDDNIEINDIYAYTKYSSEQLIILYKKLYNLNYIIFRYFNIYGDRANLKSVMANFLHNKICNINGDGSQFRDFIHVNDVVNANILAINYHKNNIFNVGSGNPISIKSLAEYTKFPIIYNNLSEFGISYSGSNIDKIKNELLWEPKISVKNYIDEKLYV